MPAENYPLTQPRPSRVIWGGRQDHSQLKRPPFFLGKVRFHTRGTPGFQELDENDRPLLTLADQGRVRN